MIPRVCSRPYRGFRRSLCLPRLGQSHENLEYAAAYVLQNKELKQNLPILLKYIGVLVAVVVMFTVVFPFTMLNAEGEEHSWITGLYWTLTVMSTLGFGNITFQTDSGRLFIGRLFSVIVLSYSTLGVDAVMSILNDRELVVLGEGVDLFTRGLPSALHGKTLAGCGIGARTGLNVVAIKHNGEVATRLTPDLQLKEGDELIRVGANEQVSTFVDVYR